MKNENITKENENVKKKKGGFGRLILRLLILAVIGCGGYWCYQEFFKKPAFNPPSIENTKNAQNEKKDYAPQCDGIIAAVASQKAPGTAVAVFETPGLLNGRFELGAAVDYKPAGVPKFNEKVLPGLSFDPEQKLLSLPSLKQTLIQQLFPAAQATIKVEKGDGPVAGFDLPVTDWDVRLKNIKDSAAWTVAEAKAEIPAQLRDKLLKHFEERGDRLAPSLLIIFDDGHSGTYALVCVRTDGSGAGTLTRYALKDGYALVSAADFDTWANERLNCADADYKIAPAVYPYRGGCSYVVAESQTAKYTGKANDAIMAQFAGDLLTTLPAQWGVK